MTYKIVFEKAAEKFLKKQDRKTQERLLKAIYKLPAGTDISIIISWQHTYVFRLYAARNDTQLPKL